MPSLVSVSYNNVTIWNGSTSLTENTQTGNAEAVYTCSVCNLVFKTEGEWNMHSLIHNRPQSQCDRCKKVFCSTASLEHHRRIQCEEKPYICGICNKTFTQSSKLRYHFGIHTSERQHELQNM